MLELLRTLFALPPGASDDAERVDWLHFSVIGTTLVASVLIAALVIFYLVRGRRRGAPRKPESGARGGHASELGAAALLLTLFLGWWVVGFRQYDDLHATPDGARVVYVTGKQWMWKFSHADGRSENDVLTVEVDEPTQLVMTSRDVIHSLFVPALRLKQDVLPGRYVSLTLRPSTPGSYPIFCAEYCGLSHSSMRGTLRVLSHEDYARWLADAPATSELAEQGREVAVRHGCLACHTVDGQQHVGPTWRGLFGSEVALTDGRTVRADDDYLTRSMMEPNDELVRGYPPSMPSYRGQLEPTETAALLAYLRVLAVKAPEPAVALPPVQAAPASAAARSAQPVPSSLHDAGVP